MSANTSQLHSRFRRFWRTQAKACATFRKRITGSRSRRRR
jgi:hypothetical protein